MLAHPRMIERCVVADEIQKQRHASCAQLFAGCVEGIPRSDTNVGNVSRYGVWGTDHVLGLPAWQGPIKLREICGIFQTNAARLLAALPHAHQPNDIEAQFRKRVPLRVRNVRERDIFLLACGKLLKPGARVDFVEMWMGRNAKSCGNAIGNRHRIETNGDRSPCQWRP